MSGDGYDTDDGSENARVNIDLNAARWDRFWAYVRWNKNIIIFGGIGGALIGYFCCGPVCQFLNNMAGNSALEIDTLESIYFMLSAAVGGVFGLGVAYCVDKRVHPENIVDFTNHKALRGSTPRPGSPHHQLSREGVTFESGPGVSRSNLQNIPDQVKQGSESRRYAQPQVDPGSPGPDPFHEQDSPGSDDPSPLSDDCNNKRVRFYFGKHAE